MIEYGYINESGYLVSKMLNDEVVRCQAENGEIIQKIVSIQEQLSELGEGWKPVEALDESKTICEAGYVIRIIPEDAGDKISFRYEKVFDKKAIREEIKKLKNRLSSTESDIGDYKITKCNEASLAGETLPCNIGELREERQKVRDRINVLQSLIDSPQ